MTAVTVRPMTAADVPAAVAIEEESFSMPWSGQGFLDALAMDCTLFLVAEQGNAVVGYIGMYFAADEAEIANVAAAKRARGCGVGTALMEDALLRAAERGIREVALEVRVSNVLAIRLYEGQGFIRQGLRKNFYERPREDAWIYTKQLGKTGGNDAGRMSFGDGRDDAAPPSLFDGGAAAL